MCVRISSDNTEKERKVEVPQSPAEIICYNLKKACGQDHVEVVWLWMEMFLLQFRLSIPPPASSNFQALIEMPVSLPALLEDPTENSVIQGQLGER